MEIKEFVIEVLQQELYAGKSNITHGNIKQTADKLIAIFDKEKKEFALECCKEMNENIKSMRSGISRDTLIENDFFIPAKFNSHLTATKLEGEK